MATRKKSSAKAAPQEPEFDFERESVVAAHLIKYNLYLLSKAVIFNSLLSNLELNEDEAAEATNRIINELDLDTKERSS